MRDEKSAFCRGACQRGCVTCGNPDMEYVMWWVIGAIAVLVVLGVVLWRMDWDHVPTKEEEDDWFR